MTLFLGPRNNYLIFRYQIHSWCAIASLLMVVFCVVTAVEKPTRWLGLAPAAALVTKKGRGVAGQCVKEVHDGILFQLFGVFEGDAKRGKGG